MGRFIALTLAAAGVAVVVTDKQATGVLNRRQEVVGVADDSWGGVDALVFAGGIGENSPAVRERSLRGLDALGLRADPARNEAARGTEAEISPEGASSRVFVIPTDEELLIARDSFRIVSEPRHL